MKPILYFQYPVYDFFDRKYILRFWIIGFYFEINFKSNNK